MVEQELSPVDEVVGKIMRMINWFNKLDPNGDGPTSLGSANIDRLTTAATALATYKAFLGEHIADLAYQLDMTKAINKQVWITHFFKAKGPEKEGDKPVSDKIAEAKADTEMHTAYLDEIELRKSHDRLKYLRQDTSGLITTIQTRVSALKREQSESSLPER